MHAVLNGHNTTEGVVLGSEKQDICVEAVGTESNDNSIRLSPTVTPLDKSLQVLMLISHGTGLAGAPVGGADLRAPARPSTCSASRTVSGLPE
jgi:hypothetical protein